MGREQEGALRPEAWRTTESQKRVLGPLLFETRRHGWNNRGLACDFARNLAKQGIAASMVGRVRMGHRGSVDVAANEANLWPQRQHDGTKRIHEAGGATDATRVGAAAKGVEVGGYRRARTRDKTTNTGRIHQPENIAVPG